MESSKHNDELIKRKLADLNVEPRKLKFAEVHANYEKANKASSNKWGLYFIVGAVGIAALISAFLLLDPNTNDQLAENTVTKEYSTTQNIPSNGTTSEDKVAEHKNSDATLSETVKEENNTSAAVKETSAERSSNDANNTANTTTKENSEIKEVNSAKKITSTGSVTKNSDSKEKTSVKKVTTTKPVNTTSSVNNELAARTKNSENRPVIKGKVRSSGLGNTTLNKKQQDQIALNEKNVKEDNSKATKTQPLANSDVVSKNGDQTLPADKGGKNSDTPANDTKEGNTTKTIAKNETSENNAGNTDQSALTQQGSNDQNNNGNTNNSNSEVKNESSNPQVAKTDPVSNNTAVSNKVDTANASSHIPGVIGTGSVSPRNKHKFLLGAEVSYSTLFYNSKENPNSPSQFSTGDPAFTTAYANAVGKGKHSLFNGAASLSYVYNEGVGISAGVSYFNLETKVDIQPARTPEYATAIDYFVWNWVPDSSTLTLQIVDTVYKQVATGNYNSVNTVVNGDSVSTLNFVNKIRYMSIPLNLSYNFKVGAKFSIEPQAGIIYTMPLKSQHLKATDAYEFEYNKQKTDLRSNLYFNAALKLGYNIGNRTQLYVRQGYFFRNQSIYNGDQPIFMSLKSTYTSFGITFRIK